MDHLLDLSGKVALVTGGSRGIGAQVVKDYAERGADVVIVSRNKEKCEDVAHEVSKLNRKALPLAIDVSNMEEIKQMYEACKESFGRLDILVNNAGVNATNRVEDVTEEDWDYIFNVNLKALFFCTQQAGEIMIPQKSGKIINISSVGGSRAYRKIAPYSASKAAVIHLTRSIANEWARYSINVNSIAPGLISTDINQAEVSDGQTLDKMLKLIPLRKLGQPKDISSMAVYLAADTSNYITGQTFFVDGGKTAE